MNDHGNPGRMNTASAQSLMARILTDRAFHVVFQPVVDLATREVFAHETLVRCEEELLRSPPVFLEAAVRTNHIGELGRRIREMAIAGCPDAPLLVNIHPHEFNDGWLIRPDDPIFWHEPGIYLEVTENVPLHYYEQCHGVLAEARSKGARLAVDDLGAGYSNLKYISDLAPDIVKLDRELIAGVRLGTRAFRLLKGIVRLCEDMDAKVVVEGIETPDELQAAIEAGAHYGQGYLLARPATVPPRCLWPGSR